jgi:hypothetical protein
MTKSINYYKFSIEIELLKEDKPMVNQINQYYLLLLHHQDNHHVNCKYYIYDNDTKDIYYNYYSAALPKASMNIPIADDNKGARMLAQMGWKKGEGLGKDKSGILNPVKAESYAQTAGIGATSKRDLSTGDGSYRSRTLDLVS